MSANLVFISYQHRDRRLASLLAQELQLRGVIPWVDKTPGGFAAGDPSEAAARRVIGEAASGFVLVLTKHTWCSDFIKTIEVPEALARLRRDPHFWGCVVSPEYGMGEISSTMREQWGADFTQFHGYSRNRRARESVQSFMNRVATEVLRKHLDTQAPANVDRIEISVSSFEPVPGSPDELLHLDVFHPLQGNPYHNGTWERFLEGMQDAKVEVARRYGRPRLLVNGSKHFTAAFLTGRVFNRFPLDIRQTPMEVWSSDGELIPMDQFQVTYLPGSHREHTLVVEVATGEKDIARGVDSLIGSGRLANGGRLQIRPNNGRVNVTDVIARSLAHHICSEIDKVTRNKRTEQIHLFVAIPQALLMTLGTLFQGMPEVHVYEWTGTEYVKTLIVPARLR